MRNTKKRTLEQAENLVSDSAQFLLEPYYESFVQVRINNIISGWKADGKERGEGEGFWQYLAIRDLCKASNSNVEEFEEYLKNNVFDEEELKNSNIKKTYDTLMTICNYSNGNPVDQTSEIKNHLRRITGKSNEETSKDLKDFFSTKINNFLEENYREDYEIATKALGIKIAEKIPSTQVELPSQNVVQLSEYKDGKDKSDSTSR